MNKSGERFDSVVRRVQSTDAARLSAEYASTRDAIIEYKLAQLQGSLVPSTSEATQSPLGPTLLSSELCYEEAYHRMHAFGVGGCWALGRESQLAENALSAGV